MAMVGLISTLKGKNISFSGGGGLGFSLFFLFLGRFAHQDRRKRLPRFPLMMGFPGSYYHVEENGIDLRGKGGGGGMKREVLEEAFSFLKDGRSNMRFLPLFLPGIEWRKNGQDPLSAVAAAKN